MSSRALGLYATLTLDPPNTPLPAALNVVMKDLGLSACSTHLFGVFAPAQNPSQNPMERPRLWVALFPTNAAIWAAHCARLPRLVPSPIPMKLVCEATDTQAAAMVCRLPVVPVQVPYPPKFYAVQVYIYTRKPEKFLAQLFIFPDIDEKEHPRIDAALRDRTAEPLVVTLVKHYDVRTILCIARGVWGAYSNMEALGMVDRPAWDAVLFAWDVIMQALERREAQDGPAIAIDEESVYDDETEMEAEDEVEDEDKMETEMETDDEEDA